MEDVIDVKEAIKTAIQMEKDGHAYYTKAAAQTSDEMGQKIFLSLAEDEKGHLAVFKGLFQEKLGDEDWSTLERSSNKYAEQPIFPKDLEAVAGANPDTNELDALHMAMDAEQQAVDFYSKILARTEDADAKKAIETIIGQEKSHYYILQEEFTHLSKMGYYYGLDQMGQ